MARSIEEIFNELVSEKQNQAELNALMPQYNLAPPGSANPFIEFLNAINTQSKTGMWRLWLFIVAVAVRAQEVFYDWHVSEVKEIIANHKPGTLLWYRSQVLAFQLNYQLVWKDGKYQYLINDPAAQIIKQCAVEKSDVVRIKAAKSDGNGGLQSLSAAETAQVQAYINRIRYADHDILFFSFPPDTVRVAYKIIYDPLVDLDALKLQVKTTQKNYLSYLANTEFGGKIVLNAMVDVLQALPAVVNPVPIAFSAKYGALPFSDYLAAGEYKSNAGYAVLDEVFFDTNTVWEAAL